MAKMTCYVMRMTNEVEVYLDEELAIQNFVNTALAWYDNQPTPAEHACIVHWLEEYSAKKYVYADISDGLEYCLVLQQSVLNY